MDVHPITYEHEHMELGVKMLTHISSNMDEQLKKLDGNKPFNLFLPKFLGDPFHRLDFK
jgi:hypothetical protein